METIKNYLESMFRGLPKTEKVLRAKSELLQMMEDKYSELIANGVSENEAVGTVISEFGNLDELADDLGISDEISVKNNVAQNSRKVSFDEIQDFLSWRMKVPVFRGLGIAFCICCVVPPIIFSSFNFDVFDNILGPVFMFIMIAIGVCLIVFSGKGGQNWSFLRNEPCLIDDRTYNYVAEKKHDFVKTYSIITSAAIACYILCCVPAIVFDYFNSDFLENLGGASLFILVATGVFLNNYAASVKSAYNFVLRLNSASNSGAWHSKDNYCGENNCCGNGDYHSDKAYDDTYAFDPKNINNSKNSGMNYKSWNENRNEDYISSIQNPKIRALMSVYWITVTCIYLCWSFITFNWHITWIIWPIAGVVNALIKAFAKTNDE